MVRISVAVTAVRAVGSFVLLAAVWSASPANSQEPISNTQAICGAWALQQVSSGDELRRIRPTIIDPALGTPGLRGFCLRVPWKAIDNDFALLEAGAEIARAHHVAYSVRFMAGRHTPARVFDSGCRAYQTARNENVPVPFLADGSPNTIFEEEYDQFVAKLASWCRKNNVRLLHLAWYGQDWAELNHGKEVRAVPGYSESRWILAHTRLLDIGLTHAGGDLAVELPFSGYGPLTSAASAFADHVIAKVGPSDDRFFCQANGWSPTGDWGAPDARTEAAFDRVWAKPICRGQQMIQPRDYDWSACFLRLRENQAAYCEIYATSFTLQRRGELAAEVAKFAKDCEQPAAR